MSVRLPSHLDYVNQGKVKMVEKLLAISDGRLTNLKDCFGKTPLMYAVKNKAVAILSLLIQYKAEVNAKNSRNGTTATTDNLTAVPAIFVAIFCNY